MSSSNNLSRSSSSWNSISILFFPLEDFTFTGVCNTSFKAFATVLNVLGNGSFFVGASLRFSNRKFFRNKLVRQLLTPFFRGNGQDCACMTRRYLLLEQ